MDLDELPLRRVCNLVWFWATDGADEKGRAKVESSLMRPLPGREKVSDAVVNYELDAFRNALVKMSG